MKQTAAVCIVVTAVLMSARGFAAEEEFYFGKRVNIIVAAAPGGGFDTYARMIARHMSKHLPGQPAVLVQNMPGGGQLIAANYIYNRAKPDGLTIGHFTGALVLQHILGNEAVMFDARKFGWLGAPVPDNGTCVFARQSGINTFEDWLNAKEPAKLGGQAPGSSISDTPRLLKAALKLPMQLIEGYAGTAPVRLAMDRGEVDGLCGWGWQSVKTTAPDKIQAGDYKVVVQATLSRHPELKGVPIAMENAKDDRARRLLEVAASIHGILERTFAAPPGLPEPRLRLLQRAYLQTLRDPELREEAAKARLEIDPVDAISVVKAVNSLYQLEADLVQELRQILTAPVTR